MNTSERGGVVALWALMAVGCGGSEPPATEAPCTGDCAPVGEPSAPPAAPVEPPVVDPCATVTCAGDAVCAPDTGRCVTPPRPTVVAGEGHVCVRLETGAVRCWGDNEHGQSGHPHRDWVGTAGEPIASLPDVDVGGAVIQLSAGGGHTCARLASGAVRCWGQGESGALGYAGPANLGDDEPPSAGGDIDLGGDGVQQVATGSRHTCVLLTSGDARCWGWGEFGQLGYGHLDGVDAEGVAWTPGDVDLGGPARQLALGRWHSCALMETGRVRCWGDGDDGALGYGNTARIGDDEAPRTVGDVDVGGPVLQIGLGVHHTCALLETGAVRCWGRGAEGVLGYGNTESVGDDEAPSAAGDVPLGGRAIQIAVGDYHTCALLDSGRVRCWGDPTVTGSLGYGHTRIIGDDETPESEGDVDVGGPVAQLAAGGGHTCAFLASGSLRCWGAGGALGYGSHEYIGNDEPPASAGDVPFR